MTVHGPRRLALAALLAVLLAGSSARPAGAGCTAADRRPIAAGGTNGATAVHAADLDGDGDVDFLSASFGDGQIAWYESDGGVPPSFTAHSISTSASGAASVFAADLDGDGDADVLSASQNDDKIAWYENLFGDGSSWIERVISAEADRASAVFAIDLDDDGDVDVLSASENDDTIAWHEQVQPGTAGPPPSFTTHVISTAADGARSVFAADLDGDGDLDVLSASYLDDTIAWYEQVEAEEADEPPSFTAHVVSDDAGGAASVHAADLDADGDPDVVSASSEDGKIAWYETEKVEIPAEEEGGESTYEVLFTKRVISAKTLGARSVFAADLNGDAKIDVVSASQLDGKIAWYENLGGGDFGSTETNQRIVSAGATGARAVFVTALGPAQQGQPPPALHVLAASSVPGGVAGHDKVAWHENVGGGAAWVERAVVLSAIAAEAVESADLDDDSDLDVVAVSTSDSKVAWYENTAGDGSAWIEHVISLSALSPTAMHVADVDSDRDLDVLVASQGDNKIAWYEQYELPLDGDTFTVFEEHVISTNAEGASSVFAAFVNADDRIDVLSASAKDDKISWYEQREVAGEGGGTTITFEEHVISDDRTGASSVRAADIDDDDLIDVIAASSGDDTIAWYEQTVLQPAGAGEAAIVFVEHIVTTSALGARSVLAADLDQDGWLDLVSASSDDHTIAWYRQERTEVTEDEQTVVTIDFTEQVIFANARLARTVDVGDVDGDGWLDVLSASPGDHTIAWHVSDGADLPAFERRPVSVDSTSVRAARPADLDGDGQTDVLSSVLFEVGWHEGGVEEQCPTFDADGDGRMDGRELIWLGHAFASQCDLLDPDPAWWAPIDYEPDCVVDGEDLAILTSRGVWGNSVDTCTFTCLVRE